MSEFDVNFPPESLENPTTSGNLNPHIDNFDPDDSSDKLRKIAIVSFYVLLLASLSFGAFLYGISVGEGKSSSATEETPDTETAEKIKQLETANESMKLELGRLKTTTSSNTNAANAKKDESTTAKSEMKTFESRHDSDLNYKEFSISYDSAWNVTQTLNNNIKDVYVSKGEYKIHIRAAHSGGAVCLIESGETWDGPGGGLDYKGMKYVEFNALGKKIKRFTEKANNEYTIQMCIQDDSYFVKPTEVGLIEYEIPDNFEAAMLGEMDKIVQSIKVL